MALPTNAYRFVFDRVADLVLYILEHPVHAGEAGEFLHCQGYYAYTQYYESTSANYEYVPITASWYSLDNANTTLTSKYVNITSSVHVTPNITQSGSLLYDFPASGGYWTISPGLQWDDTRLTWSASGTHTTNGDMYFTSGSSGYYYGFGWAQGWSPSANFTFGGLIDSEMVTVTNLRLPNGNLPESTGNNITIPLNIDPTETYDDTELLNVVESDLIECSELSSEQVVEIMVNLYEIVQDETESETESTEPETDTSCCNCNCGDTIIYVNADGTVTISNSVSGDYTLNIDNNADLSVQIQALAGAFGAGAIVVDPDAEINITAGAGAFGAGAFGAGAIVAPNVDVNGSVDVGDISGEVNLNVSDVNLEISGGDVNIDQSGSTITNNYNTTNNYYGTTEPVEPEQPFTIDYNEILSEGELESILNQETYEIIELHTETEQQIELPETIPGTIAPLPNEVVATSGTIFNYGNDIITDLGLLPVYAPLSIFSIICYILRGCK